MDGIISDEYLDLLKGRPQIPGSTISCFAHNRPRCAREVEKINAIWDLCSAEMKQNEELISRLRNTDESLYRGALAECIGYIVLSKYFTKVEHEPQIGDKTPDFLALNKDKSSHIFEVLSWGDDPHDEESRNIFQCLQRDLAPLQSVWRIFIIGNPIPSRHGNFHAIRKALADKFDTLTDSDNNTESQVEGEGGFLHFNLRKFSTVGTVVLGQSRLGNGMPGTISIQSSIEKKLKRYKMPIGLILVTTHGGLADYYALLKVILGDPAFQVAIPVIEGEAQVTSTNLQNGVLGQNNRRIEQHVSRLKSVILARQSISENGVRFFLYQVTAKASPLYGQFPDIPNYADILVNPETMLGLELSL